MARQYVFGPGLGLEACAGPSSSTAVPLDVALPVVVGAEKHVDFRSEPSVRRISTSVSVGVGMCSVVAIHADP